jgi:nitrous-oxide reductase
MVEDAFDQLARSRTPRPSMRRRRQEGLGTGQPVGRAVWQYQVKAADLGLRAKTYLEQNGAKKVK